MWRNLLLSTTLWILSLFYGGFSLAGDSSSHLNLEIPFSHHNDNHNHMGCHFIKSSLLFFSRFEEVPIDGVKIDIFFKVDSLNERCFSEIYFLDSHGRIISALLSEERTLWVSDEERQQLTIYPSSYLNESETYRLMWRDQALLSFKTNSKFFPKK